MKQLLTHIIACTSVAIVAATVPPIGDALLNAAVPTAWAQQDKGRGDKGDKERDDRDSDKDRGKGNGREDRDTDRGGRSEKGNSGRDDRDTDRGGSTDKGNNGRDDRDTDRGGGTDKGNNGRDDRDTDHAGGADKGNNGRDDRDTDRGGGTDKGNNGRDDRDTDRGGGADKGNSGRDDRDTDRGGGADKDNSGRDDRGGNDRGPGADNPKNDDSRTNVGGADTDIADRSADPADRVIGDNPDRDRETFAGRFDLDDSETFDSDGYLARRGEIIAMSSDTLLRRRAEALGLQVDQEEPLASLNTTMYRLLVPAGAPIDGILARLRAQDPQGVFDRNHLYDRSAAAVSNNPGALTHALTGTAKGVTVGLIDTGVDALHPALRGTEVQLQYFVDPSRPIPETHGTAVVSLLVSKEYGMLPDAQLYVACVFYEDRRGGSLSEAQNLVRALNWLMKLHVPVINMSLSGPPNAVLHAAIQHALDAGHLITAAVGNGGPASPPLYPAAYDGVIAVTAVDGGQHVYRRANRGPHVQLAAMGVDVVAAAPSGVATYSGTSFASPYVAALAAMDYRALDPSKAKEVKESLQANALDLGKPGRDEIYGFGLARPPTISTAAR